MARLRFPHPLVLLFGCIAVAAVLTHLVPAGEYLRRLDEATGRTVVIAGSYHAVAPHPMGLLETLMAVPRGMTAASSVIFMIFFAGASFNVLDRTGAFRAAVGWLSARFRDRPQTIILIVSLVFGALGATEGMWEEIAALVPVLLLLARRVGFDAVTVVAMTLGASGVGTTFSPVNPFNVGIAQKLAELPLLSGMGFRFAVLVPALAVWIIGTLRHAARTRRPPELDDDTVPGVTASHVLALLAFIAVITVYVVGTLRLGWGFDELSALLLLLGLVAGLLGGLGGAGTMEALAEGFRGMAYAALMVGVARAIFVVLGDGKIIDTIIDGMVAPLARLPTTLFALGMSAVQTIIAFPVPSTSGRAVLTLPILIPVSDLLGLSRQTTVLAYQYGPGLVGQFSPTEGALMAILALAGIRYEDWLRFALPLCGILMALSLVAIAVAATIGLP